MRAGKVGNRGKRKLDDYLGVLSNDVKQLWRAMDCPLSLYARGSAVALEASSEIEPWDIDLVLLTEFKMAKSKSVAWEWCQRTSRLYQQLPSLDLSVLALNGDPRRLFWYKHLLSHSGRLIKGEDFFRNLQLLVQPPQRSEIVLLCLEDLDRRLQPCSFSSKVPSKCNDRTRALAKAVLRLGGVINFSSGGELLRHPSVCARKLEVLAGASDPIKADIETLLEALSGSSDFLQVAAAGHRVTLFAVQRLKQSASSWQM